MGKKRTILLVLRSGGDFSFDDVQLIARHINGKWKSYVRPRIICLWDKAKEEYKIGDIEILPLRSDLPGTWSRIQIYSPEMEKYRPCLYIDLDTAVINSLEKLIDSIPDETKFITLEDLWQKKRMATGIAWIPAQSEKISKIYSSFRGSTGSRLDRYLREVVQPDLFFQDITNGIGDFKPNRRTLMRDLPSGIDVVCFHGKPRIFQAQDIRWVKDYINQKEFPKINVTVIIPYNRDRGWLEDAISSVPAYVQLLPSHGDGSWPANFNKALPQATGDYIRWLHEDDMLTENCIEDSLRTFEQTGADFIHGNAIEFYEYKTGSFEWKPKIQYPTIKTMLEKNNIHSATLMYKKEVFEKVGLMDESLNTAEEFEFNLRCLKEGMKIGYCNAPLAYYRRHMDQKVRVVLPLHRREEREMVKKRYV